MKKTLIALMTSAFLLASMPVEAKYGGARSVSSSRVYSAPRPAYRVPSRPIYSAPRPAYRTPSYAPTYRSSTTVINQRSGGGFLSNMLSTGAGVLGGMALFNWLKGDPAPQQAPAAVAPQAPASAASVPAVQR